MSLFSIGRLAPMIKSWLHPWSTCSFICHGANTVVVSLCWPIEDDLVRASILEVTQRARQMTTSGKIYVEEGECKKEKGASDQ